MYDICQSIIISYEYEYDRREERIFKTPSEQTEPKYINNIKKKEPLQKKEKVHNLIPHFVHFHGFFFFFFHSYPYKYIPIFISYHSAQQYHHYHHDQTVEPQSHHHQHD